MPYKYKLSVCLCVRNEAKYMDEFITHYVVQGVDHFYIINNGSTDNIETICRNKYAELVTLITDDRNLGILTADSGAEGHRFLLNEHIYPRIIHETEWAIIVDADEFMYGKNGHNLASFVDTVPADVGVIYVYWNIINPVTINGAVSREFSTKMCNKRLNYDKIGGLSRRILNANTFGKSIIRTSMISKERKLWLHKTHIEGKMVNNYGYIDDSWEDNSFQFDYSEDNFAKCDVTLNHYAIRNAEDYEKKISQLNKVTSKTDFIKGLLDILELPDEYFVDCLM